MCQHRVSFDTALLPSMTVPRSILDRDPGCHEVCRDLITYRDKLNITTGKIIFC